MRGSVAEFALVKAKTTLLGLATNNHIATNQHGMPVAVGFVLTLYVDFTSLVVLPIVGGHWRFPRPSDLSLLSVR